jgi:hypothetical protein
MASRASHSNGRMNFSTDIFVRVAIGTFKGASMRGKHPQREDANHQTPNIFMYTLHYLWGKTISC